MVLTKARKNMSRGRQVSITSAKIPLDEAIKHLQLSRRGGAWPQFRAEVGKHLNAGIGPKDAVALNSLVDGRTPTDEEIKSIETAINKFLRDEIKAKFLIHWTENIGKFILAPAEVINSIVGSRRRWATND